jgi:NADH-quinone oxidoreductase subunit F
MSDAGTASQGRSESQREGTGTEAELGTLEELSAQIMGRSFCALGDAAATPFPAAMKYFRDEFIAGTHTPADTAFDPMASTVLTGAAAR